MTTKFEAAIRAEPVELIAKWRVLEMLKEHQEIPAPEGGSAEARLVTALKWWQEDPRDLVDYDAWVEEGIAMARAALAAQPVMLNGLTEAETSETASVKGLTQAPAEGDERIKALTTVIELLDGKNRSSDRPSDYVFRAVAAARAALSEPQPKGPEGDAETLAKALEAVCLSVSSLNSGPANAITVNDERVYWQREEWVRWILDEVLPDARRALNAHTFRAAAKAPAPVAWPDEQIDALMPPPAEASEPIMKAPGYRSAQRGEYEHVGDTPDYWTRDQVRSVVRSAIASQAPAVGAATALVDDFEKALRNTGHWSVVADRRRALLAALTGATEGNAQRRLEWLHSPESNNVDGYDWGVYRVKWEHGKAAEVWHTNCDFSDLDAAMAASKPPVQPQGGA